MSTGLRAPFPDTRHSVVRSLASESAEERGRASAEATGRTVHAALFEPLDVEGHDAEARPSYLELAAEHGLSTTQVTNYLSAARRDFRATLVRTLRDLCGSDEEFRDEARELLGVKMP